MWMSIVGMYEYDPHLFDQMVLPEGVERTDVINNICISCAEQEVLYQQIDLMKMAIGLWSRSNLRTWEKLKETMYVEYNPIWNVDADITETRTLTGTDTRVIDTDESGTLTGTDTYVRDQDGSSRSTGSDNETVSLTDTESVQGFNSSSWADSHKTVKSGTDNHALTDNTTTTNDISDTTSLNENTSRDVDTTDTLTHNTTDRLVTRRTGNIGVTSTQELIMKEREIADFNLIEYITQSFMYKFCLLIY